MRFAMALPLAVAWAGLGFADEAEMYLPTALAARVETGRCAGVSVDVEPRPGGALVTVMRAVKAFPSAPSYPLTHPELCGDPRALEVPPSFAAPAELAGLGGEASAVAVTERVVELVTRRITLDENDAGPQDAATVLLRGRGRCSGRANLAVGLLRAVGIPARVVQGIVIAREGPRWHRWGEAWLGPLGWTSFDPGAAVGLVSVRYLALRGSGEGSTLAGARLVRISEHGYLGLPRRAGLRVVPVGGVRLHCLANPPERRVTAVLTAPDGSRWARRGEGEVVFEGMLPGRYRLVTLGAGRADGRDLELGEAREVRIALGSGETPR